VFIPAALGFGYLFIYDLNLNYTYLFQGALDGINFNHVNGFYGGRPGNHLADLEVFNLYGVVEREAFIAHIPLANNLYGALFQHFVGQVLHENDVNFIT